MNSFLTVNSTSASYGPHLAFQDVSFNIAEGEVVILLGANGAGKTSILLSITGILPLRSGKIEFQGSDISSKSTQSIVESGIVLVPEGRRVFPALSVQDNLRMGAFRRRKDLANNLEHAYSMFPILSERRNQLAGKLSGGEQQMLAIGRGLMAGPKLLLLDEPSLGLAPKIVESVMEVVSRIQAEGVSVLLVEQNVSAALSVADRGFVVQNGRIVGSGTADELQKDDLVSSYLY